MTKYPPIQIVDENDQPLGDASLEEILEGGLIHRVVRVMVEDENGKILLQMRGPNVATNPNTWDFSAAGYVDTGESYDYAAKRELAEELGLRDLDLKRLHIRQESEVLNGRKLNRFAASYQVVVPVNTTLNIEATELEKVEWFDVEDIKQLVENNVVSVTTYFRGWLQEHYINKLWRSPVLSNKQKGLIAIRFL